MTTMGPRSDGLTKVAEAQPLSQHDPLCDAFPEPVAPCPCDIIATVRADEKAKLDKTWRINLALISNRRYNEGYQAAVNEHFPRGST